MGNEIVAGERQQVWSFKPGPVGYTLHGRDHRGGCWAGGGAGKRQEIKSNANVDAASGPRPI